MSRRGERGQALVELALTLPILVFALLGGVDLARAFTAQMGVQNAARAAAEAAVLGRATTDAAIIAAARADLAGAPGVDASAASVSVTRTTGSAGESLVAVRIQYTFRTIVAWPLIPNVAALDRTTTMRFAQ